VLYNQLSKLLKFFCWGGGGGERQEERERERGRDVWGRDTH